VTEKAPQNTTTTKPHTGPRSSGWTTDTRTDNRVTISSVQTLKVFPRTATKPEFIQLGSHVVHVNAGTAWPS